MCPSCNAVSDVISIPGGAEHGFAALNSGGCRSTALARLSDLPGPAKLMFAGSTPASAICASRKPIVSALKQIGYQGDVVIESFTTDVKVIARAAAIWRKMEPKRDDIAVKGLANMKKVFGKK